MKPQHSCENHSGTFHKSRVPGFSLSYSHTKPADYMGLSMITQATLPPCRPKSTAKNQAARQKCTVPLVKSLICPTHASALLANSRGCFLASISIASQQQRLLSRIVVCMALRALPPPGAHGLAAFLLAVSQLSADCACDKQLQLVAWGAPPPTLSPHAAAPAHT
jgi:hypothetical protein